MGLELIPSDLRAKYRFEEREHACSILKTDFPAEFGDIMACLHWFRLKKSHILTPGGGRSPISAAIDGFLRTRGWRSKSFDIKITVDEQPIPVPTHKIDNFKHRIGVEVEWNNKTEFYDRDLNNFRLLLHGNNVIPHLPKLLVKQEHRLSKEHLAYYNQHLLR